MSFITDGRFTYSFIGRDCATGSGSVLRITFRVKENAPLTSTEIKLDDNFAEQKLLILDCQTDKFTNKGIPDSGTVLRLLVV